MIARIRKNKRHPGQESKQAFGVLGAPDWVSMGVDLDTRHAKISRSGNVPPIHDPSTPNLPDREISLAHCPVAADNFPNGKLIKP
jgi:hypothetical protein